MRLAASALSILAGLFLLRWPLPVWGQEPPAIEVTATSVDYAFGQQATFRIEAQASAGVAALYLYLQKQGEQRVETIAVASHPGDTVTAQYQRDLHRDPFPPFGQVTWWWEVHDGSGHRLITQPSVFRYEDNRFEWHDFTAGPVRLHTVVDEPAYVQAALDISQTSLVQIAEALGRPLPEGVDVYLYPSLADIRAALEMAGRDWMGGQARPELGAVLVTAPYDDEFVARMEQDIPHELAHLLVYGLTGPEGYGYVPAWLNEGLAMAYQMRFDPNLEVLLEEARAEGRLIPLADLCAPFPFDPEVSLLSYAQSASLVRYLRDQYGDAGIGALLAAYGDGAGCEGGVNQAFHLTLEQLDRVWRADLAGLSGWRSWLSENAGWLLLWGLSLLLALPVAGAFGRGGKA